MKKAKIRVASLGLAFAMTFGVASTSFAASNRLAGDDRFETSVEVAKETFETAPETVLLASGLNYADALVANGLAGEKSPILLTNGKELTKSAKAYIEDAEKVVLIGGPSSVSKDLAEELEEDFEVVRLAGKDRYETSVKVYDEIVGNKETEEPTDPEDREPGEVATGEIKGTIKEIYDDGDATYIQINNREYILGPESKAVIGDKTNYSKYIGLEVAVNVKSNIVEFVDSIDLKEQQKLQAFKDAVEEIELLKQSDVLGDFTLVGGTTPGNNVYEEFDNKLTALKNTEYKELSKASKALTEVRDTMAALEKYVKSLDVAATVNPDGEIATGSKNSKKIMEAVEKAIVALPKVENVTLADRAKAQAIQYSLNNIIRSHANNTLSEEYQDKLQPILDKLAALVKSEEKAAKTVADSFRELVGNPAQDGINSLTVANDAAQVKKLVKAYDNLTAYGKNYASEVFYSGNTGALVEYLTKAEVKIDALSLEAKINDKLSSEIKLEDEKTVNEIRLAYEKLLVSIEDISDAAKLKLNSAIAEIATKKLSDDIKVEIIESGNATEKSVKDELIKLLVAGKDDEDSLKLVAAKAEAITIVNTKGTELEKDYTVEELTQLIFDAKDMKDLNNTILAGIKKQVVEEPTEPEEPTDDKVIDTFLASGVVEADALVASAVSGRDGMPILLTTGKALSEDVADRLDGDNVTIVGGKNTIADNILEDIDVEDSERVAGSTRELTAVEVADKYYDDANAVVVANGYKPSDALVSGPLAVKLDAPILLVQEKVALNEVKDIIKTVETLKIVGGPNSISNTLVNELNELVK